MTRVGKRTAPPAALPNRVRIIGGQWRGMRIDFPPLPGIRPSPDRVRETLFNWLQHSIAGARCLDLFAGSGALGIEALSRGAAHVTFVDREARIQRHLTATLQKLGAADVVVRAADAMQFLEGPRQTFDVVFLDPPFASDMLQDVCNALATGWLSKGAYIYLECPSEMPIPALPPGWSVHRSKRAGQVGYHLLRSTAPSERTSL